MNRKKIIAVLLSLCLIFTVSPSFVYAQTDSTAENTATTQSTDTDIAEEAGVTPDSLIYPLEQMIESVQVALTFSDDGKAELLISFANERLAEARIMDEKNQQDLMRKVVQAYTRTINNANTCVQKLIEIEKAEAAEDTNTDETAVPTEKEAKINKIIDSIEVVQNDADEIVIKVTGTLPEEQAEQMQSVIKAQVQNTIAMKAYMVAKNAYVESAKEYAEAKNELEMAEKSGDEAAIQAAQEKVDAAKESKEEMKELKKEVKELKKEVREENKETLKDIIKHQHSKEWREDNKDKFNKEITDRPGFNKADKDNKDDNDDDDDDDDHRDYKSNKEDDRKSNKEDSSFNRMNKK